MFSLKITSKTTFMGQVLLFRFIVLSVFLFVVLLQSTSVCSSIRDGKHITTRLAREVLPYSELSLLIYDRDREPYDWTLIGDSGGVSGFYAEVYQRYDELVVVFEGTDIKSLSDSINNLIQVEGIFVPPQYLQGLKLVRAFQKKHSGKITLTGHSLGGGIAQYVGSMLDLPVYSFNSAGLGLTSALQAKKSNTKSQIYHILTKGYNIYDVGNYSLKLPEVDMINLGMYLKGDVLFVPVTGNNNRSGNILDVHSMERLHGAIKAIAYTSDQPNEPKNAVAVIDTSSSMRNSDPTNLRKKAMEMIVDSVGANVSLGITTFSDSSKLLSGLHDLGEYSSSIRRDIKSRLHSIDSRGGTNISSGIKLALKLLPENQPENSEILLLTDGEDANWKGDASSIPEGVKVHTIAFTSGADVKSLSRISTETGGIPELASDALSLHKIIRKIFGSIYDEEVHLVREGTIKEGEIKEYVVYIATKSGVMEFAVTWPGSNIDMVVISPDGQRYDSVTSARNGNGVNASTYDIIRVRNAKPGRWQVKIKGVDIAPGGEPFTLRAASQQSSLKTEWVANSTVAEIKKNYSLDIKSDESVNWTSADISIRKPDGQIITEQENLDNVAGLLSGGINQSILNFTPDQVGIYQVTVHAKGTVNGEIIQRAWDNNLRVVERGEGMRYSHKTMKFIRRAAE